MLIFRIKAKKGIDNGRRREYNQQAKESRQVHPPHLKQYREGVEHRSSQALPVCFDGCNVCIRFLIYQEVFSIAKMTHQLNEEIQDKELRVIGEDGAQLGIMSAEAALALAEEQDLDLVKISPNAVPPVCKIMDYGKFRFDQMKKEKEAKKNQHVVEIKEVRMSPGIDTNDFNTKVRSALKFLKDGNRVKVSVRFRGREMAHTEIGKDLLDRFAEQCAEMASMEKTAKMEGRSMSIFLAAKTAK